MIGPGSGGARGASDSIPDVLIVGAGPAGSSLAFLLAGLGWQVQVVDRAFFPRPKPCGECVNPGAVRILRRLGLLDAVMALGPVSLEGWRLRTGQGNGGIGHFGPEVPAALGISRAALDETLVRQAVARGVRLHEGVRVMRVIPGKGGDAPRLETMNGAGERRCRSARFVVGADGLRSVVARRLGMVRPEPRLRKISLTCRLRGTGPPRSTGLLHVSDAGTVGLAPVVDPQHAAASEAGTLWNGTVVVHARRGPEMKGNAEGFFRRIMEPARIPWDSGFDVIDGPWPSGAFDWPARKVTCGRLLLVGDAAGYFDPLTGQGIFRALRSAELAAAAIDRCLRDDGECEAALRRYATLLARSFRPGRGLQRVIEGVLARRGPRETVLQRIGNTPGGLGALIRVTGDVAPVRSLLAPRLLAGLAGVPGIRPPSGQ